MASMDKALAGFTQVGNVATDSKTNVTATATQAAPSAGNCLLIAKIIISMSAAPAAAVRALVQYGVGPTTLFAINIPASALSPVQIDLHTHPIKLPEAVACSVIVPALGAGVVCDVVLTTIATGT